MNVWIGFVLAVVLGSNVQAGTVSLTQTADQKEKGYVDSVHMVGDLEVHISAPSKLNVERLLPDQSTNLTPSAIYETFESRSREIYPGYSLGFAIKAITDGGLAPTPALASQTMSPNLVNYSLSGQFFGDPFVLKYGQDVTYGPTGLVGNNANGVVTTITVSAGTVELDLLQGAGLYKFVALVNNGFTSTYFSLGYPGRYGSKTICNSKKTCKGVSHNVFIN